MSARKYRFGLFELDGVAKRISHPNKVVSMEPKDLDVLLYLVEHPGRLVWKEEILESVWPSEKKGDGRLRVCMCAIRKALSDNADAPEFIRTFNTDGYWFIAQVCRVEGPVRDLDWCMRPPGAQYDKNWYVPSGMEPVCLVRLGHLVSPLALQGPRRSGKRTLLAHLLNELQHSDSHTQVVRLDLSKFPLACFDGADMGPLLREMAQQILQTLRVTDERALVERSFKRFASVANNMTVLMETKVLEWVSHLILTVERVEILKSCTFRDSFFAMLRGWSQQDRDPWPRLRIACTLSTYEGRLDTSGSSPFFNVACPIKVTDFTEQQLQSLALRHRLDLDTDELGYLWQLLRGHPLLTRMLLYSAATMNRRPKELVSCVEGEFGPLTGHLHGLQKEVIRAGLLEEVRALACGTSVCLSEDDGWNLYELGIVAEEPIGGFRLRCKLYEEFFKRF